MKLCSTVFIIFFCGCQLAFTITSGPCSGCESDKGIVSWNGPSGQNDANAYVQRVQDFWTDERLAAANPKPMSIDDKSFLSGGETKK